MNRLFNEIAILSSLLIFINCYAVDSTDSSLILLAQSQKIRMQSEVVPDTDKDQCQLGSAITAKEAVGYYLDNPSSSCPLDFPFPKSVTIDQKGALGFGSQTVYLYCCKEKIRYQPQV